MPVTVHPVDHPANPYKSSAAGSPEKLIETACPKQWRRCQRIVQTSLTDEFADARTHITASENGFVWAAYEAYCRHHHLVLRPEDVWFSILTQLSFYINAHAEELREFFVAHEGQKDLEAISYVADFGALALQMTDLLAKNVNDPALRDWVMPDFSTTTHSDRVVGAALFMGAMQAYFSYKMSIACGIPSVTLLGEVDDWRKILGKLDMIDQLGEEPKQFANMLRPVLKHMVQTFEDPGNDRVNDFWNRIVHRNRVGSGTDYLSGWLTAFCFWNDQGEPKKMRSMWSKKANVLFDGVEYPYVDIDKVPLGYAAVPVKVDDNGYEYEATLVAGSIGIAASSSNNPMELSITQDAQEGSAANRVASEPPIRDTVQPISAWFILENEKREVAEERATEKKALEEQLERYRGEWRRMDKERKMEFAGSPAGRERDDAEFEVLRKLREIDAF